MLVDRENPGSVIVVVVERQNFGFGKEIPGTRLRRLLVSGVRSDFSE